MKTIEISTHLDAHPDKIKEQVMRPALLEYVAKGMIRFRPVSPLAFPDVWGVGCYKVALYWRGVLPLGRQSINISFPQMDDAWVIRDKGSGTMVKTWDHFIEVWPEGQGCRYVDRVAVDAGVFTAVVARFAARFYRHRQKRLHRLAQNGFDYSA